MALVWAWWKFMIAAHLSQADAPSVNKGLATTMPGGVSAAAAFMATSMIAIIGTTIRPSIAHIGCCLPIYFSALACPPRQVFVSERIRAKDECVS